MDKCSQRTRVLITVMTYPLPSRKSRELICTAGITEAGEWVRLFPIDYRYRPKTEQFRKYQWIEIGLTPNAKDHRKESRRPDLDSIVITDKPLSTDHGWRERRSIIDQMPVHTRHELERMYDEDHTSLGIVKPVDVVDLKIEPADPDWSPERQAILQQMVLFGPPPKPLRKLPYKFSYVFRCEDSVEPHSAMIEDWELGTLFLKEAARLGSDEAAAQSVKRKFLNEMCSRDKDTRFFMGTVHRYNSWVVIGVFWPPKVPQMGLDL